MAGTQSHICNHCIRSIAQVLILLCLSFVGGYGQFHNDDLDIKDLRTRLRSSTDMTVQAYLLRDHGLYYQKKDYMVDSVFHYAEKLLDLSKEHDHPIAGILGLRLKGNQYRRISKFKEARHNLQLSIELSKKHDYFLHIHDSYQALASAYRDESKLDSAVIYFNKAIDSAPEDSYSKLCNFYIALSDVYMHLGNSQKEEELMVKAYDLSKQSGRKLDQMISLNNLLSFYSFYPSKTNAALFNDYKRAYDQLSAEFGLDAKYHFSSLFRKRMPFDDRIAFLNQTLEDNIQRKFIQGAFTNYTTLAETTYSAGEYQACIDYCNEAIAFNNIGNEVLLPTLVELYRYKYKAESQIGQLDVAIKTADHYLHLKDSLVIAINAKHVEELALKYETAAKNAQLSEMEVKTSERTAQRNYAIILSGFLLSIGFFLWRRAKLKRLKIETENKLQAEKINSLEKEKRILSLTSMIEGQEAERTRIAQDLHDGLGGLLSSVRNHFSLIEEEVKKVDNLNVYDRTNEMIDQACKEVRRISHNLMPAGLQLNGLVSTLAQYCDDIDKSKKISIQFEHAGLDDQRLDERKKVFIYRIVQEAVSNVLKHADAKTTLVQFGIYEKEVSLIIEDDGRGFVTDDSNDGIGLHSIKSRVDNLDGQIDIDSRVGEGTTITINIPI